MSTPSAAPVKAGKSARKAKSASPAPAPAQTTTEEAGTPAPAPKAPKVKLVRDSFTIPQLEYDQLSALKRRALGLAHHARKSELLRAGIAVLAAMDDASLLSALQAVPPLKTGRPKKDAKVESPAENAAPIEAAAAVSAPAQQQSAAEPAAAPTRRPRKSARKSTKAVPLTPAEATS